MAGTRNLDRLLSIAVRHGARLRLLGDYRQLAAVESGGALRLLATDVGAVELSTLHRFNDPAEAAATLKIRVGDSSGLDFYAENDRIRSGSTSAMTEAAYAGWLTDMRAGLTTFMPAATNTDVVALSARARLDRVQTGQVEAAGVELHDGNHAGAGDWIVTRRNDRRLAMNRGRDWVRNGDPWRVLNRHDDGSLNVEHLARGGRVHLPATYVRVHVELLYASTVHRVQGGTVDTAHPLITDAMTREHLYVATTRGSQRTTLYVATHDVLHLDDDERLDATRHDPDARAAREVLLGIIGHEGAERSATETIRDLQNAETSLATLIPRYLHADTQAAMKRHKEALHQVFDEELADALPANSAWPELARALRRGEHAGWTAEQLLANAQQRQPDPLEANGATASRWSPGHWEALTNRMAVAVDDLAADRPPVQVTRPSTEQATRYALLITGITGLDAALFTADTARTPPSSPTAHRSRHEVAPATPPSPGPDGDPDRHSYAHAIGQSLGSKLANRALRESAWPALQRALQRADAAGYDPEGLLRQHTNRRDLTRTLSVSEAFAWRIQRHITLRPPPEGADAGSVAAATATAAGERASGESQASQADPLRLDDWRTLAWTLTAHERTGGDPADLLPGPAPPDGQAKPMTLTDVLHHVQDHIPRPAPAVPEWNLPPWTPPPPAHDGYLNAAARAIQTRMEDLAFGLEQDRPDWANVLGQPPIDPAAATAWRLQAGIAAAYREHHQITDTDPAHPLGPYIEPDQHGHHDYWHAAAAIINARSLNDRRTERKQLHESDPANVKPTADIGPDNDPRMLAVHRVVAHRVAADTYQALPDAERVAVAAGLVARLGNLWFGPEDDTDAAVVNPLYADQLRASLAERGHLSDAISDPRSRISNRSPMSSLRGSTPRTGSPRRTQKSASPQEQRSTSARPIGQEGRRQPAPQPLVRPVQEADPRQPRPRF